MAIKSCCCCFSLRTGCIIIGILELVGVVLGIAQLIFFRIFITGFADYTVSVVKNLMDSSVLMVAGTQNLTQEEQKNFESDLKQTTIEMYNNYIFPYGLVTTIILSSMPALLIWGAVRKRRNLLLPWLSGAIAVTLVVLGVAVACAILVPFPNSIPVVILLTLEILLLLYVEVVVYSFYQELKENEVATDSPAEMERLTTSKV